MQLTIREELLVGLVQVGLARRLQANDDSTSPVSGDSLTPTASAGTLQPSARQAVVVAGLRGQALHIDTMVCSRGAWLRQAAHFRLKLHILIRVPDVGSKRTDTRPLVRLTSCVSVCRPCYFEGARERVDQALIVSVLLYAA
jgi:hypothetical protein